MGNQNFCCTTAGNDKAEQLDYSEPEEKIVGTKPVPNNIKVSTMKLQLPNNYTEMKKSFTLNGDGKNVLIQSE